MFEKGMFSFCEAEILAKYGNSMVGMCHFKPRPDNDDDVSFIAYRRQQNFVKLILHGIEQ